MQVSSINVHIIKSPHRRGFLRQKMPRMALRLTAWCWRQMYRHRNKKSQHRREREDESDACVGIFPVDK